MSNFAKHASMKAQAKNTAERLDQLEQAVARVLVTINKRFEQQEEKFSILDEFMMALTQLVPGVEDKVEENRLAASKAEQDRAEAELRQGVAEGYFVAANTIDEQSIVVGIEKTAAGEFVGPGRFHVPMPKIDPSYREQLLGKETGAVITTSIGGTFEVVEIYSVNVDKYRSFVEARMQAAMQSSLDQAAAADASADTQAPVL